MTASAGSGPERPRDLTRPDLQLPRRGPEAEAPPPPPPVPPVPVPVQVRPEPSAAPDGRNWHRLHYPVGAFLLTYGLAGLVSAGLGWSDRREELAGYLGEGIATPALAAVKAVEGLLIVLVLAGLLRRRDVWFLPALTGWLLGFGVFAVLDLVKGKWTALAEHGTYLGGFALLLFVSYALSVKARVSRRPPPPAPDAPDGAVPEPQGQEPAEQAPAPQEPGPPRLTRTQEMALATFNRAQQAIQTRRDLPLPRRPESAQPEPAHPAEEQPAPDPDKTQVDER